MVDTKLILLGESLSCDALPIRTFKRSNDPKFAEKVEDVVGLYMCRSFDLI